MPICLTQDDITCPRLFDQTHFDWLNNINQAVKDNCLAINGIDANGSFISFQQQLPFAGETELIGSARFPTNLIEIERHDPYNLFLFSSTGVQYVGTQTAVVTIGGAATDEGTGSKFKAVIGINNNIDYGVATSYPNNEITSQTPGLTQGVTSSSRKIQPNDTIRIGIVGGAIPEAGEGFIIINKLI